jgi:hypothetical protein
VGEEMRENRVEGVGKGPRLRPEGRQEFRQKRGYVKVNSAEEYAKMIEEENRLWEESRKHGKRCNDNYRKQLEIINDWIERNCTDCKFRSRVFKSPESDCHAQKYSVNTYFVARKQLEGGSVDCSYWGEKVARVRKRKKVKDIPTDKL